FRTINVIPMRPKALQTAAEGKETTPLTSLGYVLIKPQIPSADGRNRLSFEINTVRRLRGRVPSGKGGGPEIRLLSLPHFASYLPLHQKNKYWKSFGFLRCRPF